MNEQDVSSETDNGRPGQKRYLLVLCLERLETRTESVSALVCPSEPPERGRGSGLRPTSIGMAASSGTGTLLNQLTGTSRKISMVGFVSFPTIFEAVQS